MRHRIVKKTLGRDKDHRKALLMNLSQQLIENEKVETTLAKAKYLRPHIEKLVTKAKKTAGEKDKVKVFNTVKELRKKLKSEKAIKKLVQELSVRYKERPGGYVKITKTRNRDGDKAMMARIEFIKEKKEIKKPRDEK